MPPVWLQGRRRTKLLVGLSDDEWLAPTLHPLNLALELTYRYWQLGLLVIIVPSAFLIDRAPIEIELRLTVFAFALPFPPKVEICELQTSTIQRY
jgi:hypothetical protein